MSWKKHYPQAGKQFAGFDVVRKIGSGGMAEVFLIRDPGLAVLRALKVVRLEFEEDVKVKYRFHREAKLHAQVQDNPQWVIPIHVYGVYEEIPYIVMPYLPAGSLMDLFKAYGPLSTKVVAKIILELANGLTITERAGLVHRDIKPSNILLQPNGYIGLSDFGMSSYQRKSAARSVAGTPGYMPPEQFIPGNRQDVRTDIFSLGCTLHYLLCGSSPFGDNVADVLNAHQKLKEGILPEIEQSFSVSPKLLQVRDKALQFKREDRFQNSEEIAILIRSLFDRDFLDKGLVQLKGLVTEAIEAKRDENLETLAETALFQQES